MISHMQMKYLLAVALTGNITKAAAQLHITQPSLSNQIIALEKQLGIPLLERRRKRVYLTEAGKYFARQAQKILAEDQSLEHSMKEFAQLQKGSLRIGLLPILCPLQLPEMVAAFQKKFPQIHLDLTVDGSSNLLENLVSDDLDCVIAIMENDNPKQEVTAIPLKTSAICAALHEKEPLAAYSYITPQQLFHKPLIISSDSFVLQHIILESIKLNKNFPERHYKCNQIESCLALADKNMGITFCSPEVASYYHFPHIVLRPLQPAIERCVYLVYKKDPTYFPLLQAFIQHIEKSYNVRHD